MPTEEDDKDVVVTLDDTADKTAEEIAAEKAIDDLKAADEAGRAEPDKLKPAEKPLTAEEGKDDLAAQLKAMEATATAERKAREAAEREAAEAREAAKRSQGDVMAQRAQVVAAAIETVSVERKQARDAYKAAMEAGDYDAAATAQEQIADSAAKLVRLQEAKAAFEAQKGKPVPTHEGRVEKPAPKQQDAFEDAISNLSPVSQAWARRNPSCFTDQKTYSRVLSAHHAAVADDIQPDTPAYFEFLEERIGLRQKPPAVEQVHAAPKIRTGAPPTRDTGGSSRMQGNRITLTAAEREAAEIAGISPEQYARNLLALEREGELGKFHR